MEGGGRGRKRTRETKREKEDRRTERKEGGIIKTPAFKAIVHLCRGEHKLELPF